jgi:hypothetical protein
MTYRCGIGPGLGAMARDPAVSCDAPECAATVVLRSNIAPAWLLNGKAPKGWACTPRMPYDENGCRPKQRHFCPEHKEMAK